MKFELSFNMLKRSCRRRTWGPAVFLHHSDTTSLRICMPSLAFEPNCCTDTRAATADGDGNNLSRQTLGYTLSLIFANIDTLESRREQLTERFFRRSVLGKSSCLHYLLPDQRDSDFTDRLRHAKASKPLLIKTERFRSSFTPYCLNHWLVQLLWIIYYCCHRHWTLTLGSFYSLLFTVYYSSYQSSFCCYTK